MTTWRGDAPAIRTSTTVEPAVLPVLRHGAIPGIDGMRAVSVTIVLFAHYGFERLIPGGLGVTAFFFISGFLITTLMLRESADTGRIAIPAFFARRLLRLQPELIAFVLISGFAIGLIDGIPKLGDFLAAFFYVSNYYQLVVLHSDPTAWFRWPHLWSLAVEEHYYFTYPFVFAAFFAVPRRFLAVLVGICVVALAYRLTLAHFGVGARYLYEATEARIDSIVYGCLGAMLLWHKGPAIGRIVGKLGLLPVLVGIGLLVFTLLYRDEHFRNTVRYSVQGLAFILIFIGFYAGQGGQIFTRVLDLPVLRWMGRMSYAAYLWHLEPALIVSKLFNLEHFETLPGVNILVAVALCVVTFGIAWVSHLVIYRPFLGLRHRFGSHAKV